MLREFLATTMLFDLPLIALAMFLAIFLTVLLRTCQRSRRAEYDRMATLPLQDDAERSHS